MEAAQKYYQPFDRNHKEDSTNQAKNPIFSDGFVQEDYGTNEVDQLAEKVPSHRIAIACFTQVDVYRSTIYQGKENKISDAGKEEQKGS